MPEISCLNCISGDNDCVEIILVCDNIAIDTGSRLNRCIVGNNKTIDDNRDTVNSVVTMSRKVQFSQEPS